MRIVVGACLEKIKRLLVLFRLEEFLEGGQSFIFGLSLCSGLQVFLEIRIAVLLLSELVMLAGGEKSETCLFLRSVLLLFHLRLLLKIPFIKLHQLRVSDLLGRLIVLALIKGELLE